MPRINVFLEYLTKLNKVKEHFPNLNFNYEQFRGSNTKSFIHEAWVLYNLIEVFEPKQVFGLWCLTENSIEWRESYLFPKRFYHTPYSGKKGPEGPLRSVIPHIKIIQKTGNIIYIGYQNSFHLYRPDFSIYLRFRDIKLRNIKNRIDVVFDDKIITSICFDNKSGFWYIENYNFSPDVVVEAKESKSALTSKIRSNIKKYKEMFPNTKIIVVCPEKIEETKLNGCFFVLDTFDKELLERRKCDKNKFQDRLRQVIF